MKILAVDLGLARTGIAISDVNQILASPFCVIAEKNKEILLQKIHEICKKEKIEKIEEELKILNEKTNWK